MAVARKKPLSGLALHMHGTTRAVSDERSLLRGVYKNQFFLDAKS